MNLNERIYKLQQLLGTEAVLIENPLDLFYLTDLDLSAGKLLVTKTSSLLFVDSRYIEMASEQTLIPVQLDHNIKLDSFLHTTSALRIDPKNTSYARFLKLRSLLPQTELIFDLPFITQLRSIKDSDEVALMKKSAALNWKGFEYIQKQLQEGITEKELAKRFELFCLQEGAQKLAFDPIIAFGKNTAMPHYHPRDVPLQQGDAVLIDIGVVVDHYHSDMTRVVFFGKKDPEIKRLYTLAKRAHDSALALALPNTPVQQLDHAVRAVLRQEGMEPLFTHALGHGIGLQTHEFPLIRASGDDREVLLQPGMTFTIEPGLYLPGRGGVRYENTVLIKESGVENWYP